MSDIYRGPDNSPGCATCPCATNGAPTKPIRGAGALGSLAIVGEGPATEELAQGWPFVGESGKLLQKVLNDAGIDRNSLWITNSLLCQRPYDKDALSVAIECCRPRLRHELSLVQPKVVLALGNTAARAMQLPVTAITDARGTVQNSPLAPSPVITAIHPAAILRGGAGEVKGGGKQKMNVDAQMIFLQADVAKAYKLATTGVEEWADTIALHVAPTDAAANDIAALYTEINSVKTLLAIDLEWNKQREITWLGLASPERAISLYWPEVKAHKHIPMIVYDMGATSQPKLFHNLQADIDVWESQIGPIRGPVEDTMLMHHAAYPGAAHDLQQVTSQLLLVPPWKATRAMEEKDASRTYAARLRAEKKALKQMEHQARNAATAGQAAERKRQRVSAHEKRNATAAMLKLLGGDDK